MLSTENLLRPLRKAGIQRSKRIMRPKYVPNEDAGTAMLLLAYDNPDAVGIIKMHGKRGRTENLEKSDARFNPTSTEGLPRGPCFQSLLRENNRRVRDYLVSGFLECVLLENNNGPLIATYGGRIAPTRSCFTPMAEAGREGSF